MDDLNQVAIAGRLTRDPQLRTTRNGTQICSLRIACNKMFFNIKIWGDQGQHLAASASKGDIVQVEGRLDWYEWTPSDGPRREFVGVVANDTPGAVRCIASAGGPAVTMGQQFAPQSMITGAPVNPMDMPPTYAAPGPDASFGLSAQPPVGFTAAPQPQPMAPPPPAGPVLSPQGFMPAPSAQPQPTAPPPQRPAAPMPQGFSPTTPLMAPNPEVQGLPPNPGIPELPQATGAGDVPGSAGIQPVGVSEPEPPFQAPVPVGVGAEATDVVEEDGRFM
jgi:single-strand DNA-binding protein